jgi:hypothetical protein
MTLSKADIDLLFGPEPADSVESLLDAPITGEDISLAMQDPAFTPTQKDYLKFEEYSKTKQVDWINTIAQSVDAAANMIGGAISEGAQGAVINPLNYIEGAAQGTRQLYGLVAQSQDPSSPLFKFKDLVAGSGTVQSRYEQFLDARDFANRSAQLESGQDFLAIQPEFTNPQFVQGVSMILDPTLALPGIGEILGAGKLATKAVGKGAQLTGRAVAGVARPLERFAGAAERIAAETIGTTPEALRSVASTAGIAGALGIAPEAAAFAAIPAGIRTAREAGEALARAGENLMTQPSRIGPLEAIGAAPGANMRQRMLGVIGQYGGDAAVDASLRGLAGGIEGAAIGTGLGFLSGGEEGAAAGLGSGGVQGAAGALGGRAYQKLTGEAAREARAGDLGRFIDGQQDPTTKALFERLRDTHGVDAASGLMDLQGLVRGKLGDVEVEYLSNEDFTKRYKISARGVQVDDKGGRPAVVINADIIGRGKGDGPLYTLGHELFHALEKSTQLQGGATEIKNALVGRWFQEGDTIRKLSEGAFSDAEIEARFNQYRDKLGAGNASMADELAQYDTINKKADYVASELAAEHFAGLLAGQKPDALLKGFTGLTRQLVDLALTQNASRALAEAAASIERTFGVKPTDSVLFPDLQKASPQVNAMLRDLLRARRKLDEKINIQDDKTKAVLKPEDVANPLAAKQLIELGLAEQMPDGTVRAMSTDEIVAREKKDQDSLNAIIENTPGNSRMVDGVALGRLSPNQLSAIEQSQTVSSRMKDKIRSINATMDAGTSLNITYSAALKKMLNRLTGKQVNRYSSGIRLSDRDMLPYSFYFSKAANPVVKAIDISKVRDAILKDTASNGSVGKGLWDNVDGFMGDLAKYFTNLDQKEGARRSAEIFGLEKAQYLGDFVGAAGKGGSKFIRDFRLDRIGSMAPSGFRARFSEEAYQLSKNRWMPAEKLGDKSVINSEEGYRIISGAKHKLYSPDGKLIGIYDTQTQAERKADATQERIQPEVRQQQRQTGDEGRQATEAGGRNRIERGQEGQGEGGAVRQAGDVVIAPDAESFTIPKADMGRFMPASDKVRLEDYADRKIIALAADRMGIGQMTVGPKGAKRDLSVLGQGGRGFMNIFNGGGWAFSDQSTADRFIGRLKKDADPNGNVIVGITVQSPINHLKNQTGQLAYLEAMQAAIDSKTITKRAADSQIAAMSSAIVNSTAKSIKQSARDKFSKINSLADLKNAVQNKQLNFADMEPLLTQMQRKALPITAKELAAAGISPADIARDIADPELADVPFGSVVALLGVNVKQAPEKTGFHYSYPWTIHGETIGYLDKFYNISDLTTEQRIRNKAGTVTAQPLQTVMPVMDNIINTIKTKQGIPSVPSERFMPAQQAFYSKLEEVVTSKLPKLASSQQVLASVDPAKGSGVKPEELKWTGFAQAVERIAKENGGKVPKEKLIEHLNNEGSVNFEEVTLGTIWNVGDSNHTERYTNLKDALSAKEEVIDFLKSETERGWSVEEQDDGFVIVDEYGDRIREQRSDSGRVVWKPYTYRSEAEAKAAIKEGAKDVAESSVVFNENQVQGSAIHADYQLPGGENYREVVLTSDTANPYTSSHYTHIENYVAHMRLNDRTATDGRNGLFIEEIQSDRHQQSREKGYGADWSKVPVYKYSDLVSKGVFPSEMHIESKPGTYSLVSADGATLETSSSLEKLKSEYDRKIGSIPDAPFRKDWSLQMFKRALRDAVASDKKWIGWTTGDTQAARYDLSKQVDYIDYRQVGTDKYDVSVVGKNGSDLFSETGINKSRVSDVVGKEIADKMVKGEGQSGGGRMTLRGLDLKVGGEGMKGFYDEILPKEVKKYVKQWGAEVTKSNVPESEIWRVDITPQMRKSIETIGQARFMPASDMASGRSVKDYGEAVDLFEKGYRIYGAPYDGMEDPIRLKKVTEIENYDPENLWAVPSKKIAAAIGIRNMPADLMPSPDSAMPGAYSFPGGYRALPGKAKGSLRLYGPAGSLIGIASSLDEAQRILRRKNK